MAVRALAGWVLFGILAIGGRCLLQYWRTGSSGLRLPSRTAGASERLGGALLLVAVVSGVLAPVLALNGRLPPWLLLDRPAVHAVGALLYLAGLVVTLWAQLTMGASWRIGVDTSERTRLVHEGPFRWVRNPIFTAMVVAIAGLALLVPNAAAALSVAALVAGLEIHVRGVEEPYLLATHGEAYARYAEATGRFLPGVGRSVRR